MTTVIQVPKSLVYMIKAYNEQLQELQKQFLEEVQTANSEIMHILNLNPEDGWKLDLENFTYIRPDASSIEEQPQPSETTPTET